MNKSSDNLSGVILNFDSGVLPAPYSNMFRIHLDWSSGDLHVKLDLHYTNREDISDQEILDEGFSLDDDFSYQGKLNNVWGKEAGKKYHSSKWSGKQLSDAGITVNPIEDNNELGTKIPADQDGWLLLGQDIIQAIFETTGRESPLTIHYRSVNNDKNSDCSLTVHFSNREVLLTSAVVTRTINWEYAMELMKLIFTPDYDYQVAKESAPSKKGNYIECGDGLWHQLGKGVINIDESFDAVGKIQSRFGDLLAE
jgi:hypothetical protein